VGLRKLSPVVEEDVERLCHSVSTVVHYGIRLCDM
jgi:hypothetical protein